jgi:hypothetical protein
MVYTSVNVHAKMLRRMRPILLGRWNRKRAGRKADLANHDHCGGVVCGRAELTKAAYDNTMDVIMCVVEPEKREKRK